MSIEMMPMVVVVAMMMTSVVVATMMMTSVVVGTKQRGREMRLKGGDKDGG